MTPLTTLLEIFGLTTKRRLKRAVAKRNLWHGLVRDVFAQYYLKFRETFPDHLPQLPHRYSQGWETALKRELDGFLRLDLTEVGTLLETCGFGTEKWDALRQAGFPKLGELIDQYLVGHNGNGQATAAQIAAFGADIGQIAADNPALLEELSQRYDPEAGSLIPTDEEIRTSLLYRELEDELRKLRSAGHRALDQIKDYETRLEEMENQLDANGQAPIIPTSEQADGQDTNTSEAATQDIENSELAELTQQNAELTKELVVRDQTIEDLKSSDQALGELKRQNEQFDNDLKAKTHRLETLEQEREKLANDLEAKERTITALSAEGSDEINNLTRENEDLRREMAAKEHTVNTLRKQLDSFESELGGARNQLLNEVHRLEGLTSGKIDLKPSEELEQMNPDELMSYAQEVAQDVDVQKQTLEEGLQTIDSLKANYEQSHDLFESQQRDLQDQLEKMRVELETYEQQDVATSATPTDGLETVSAQREQLELLSSRIRELINANKDLDESNKKMYRDLETAVRRVIPLRNQIEELESLRETLTNYIRTKYDRSFNIRNMGA